MAVSLLKYIWQHYRLNIRLKITSAIKLQQRYKFKTYIYITTIERTVMRIVAKPTKIGVLKIDKNK